MAATSFHPRQQPRERESYLQCFGLKDSRRLRKTRSDRISSKALKISPRYSPEFRERKQARSSSKVPGRSDIILSDHLLHGFRRRRESFPSSPDSADDRISSKALKISPRYSPEFRERKQARSSSKSLEEVILFSLIISSMDSPEKFSKLELLWALSSSVQREGTVCSRRRSPSEAPGRWATV